MLFAYRRAIERTPYLIYVVYENDLPIPCKITLTIRKVNGVEKKVWETYNIPPMSVEFYEGSELAGKAGVEFVTLSVDNSLMKEFHHTCVLVEPLPPIPKPRVIARPPPVEAPHVPPAEPVAHKVPTPPPLGDVGVFALDEVWKVCSQMIVEALKDYRVIRVPTLNELKKFSKRVLIGRYTDEHIRDLGKIVEETGRNVNILNPLNLFYAGVRYAGFSLPSSRTYDVLGREYPVILVLIYFDEWWIEEACRLIYHLKRYMEDPMYELRYDWLPFKPIARVM